MYMTIVHNMSLHPRLTPTPQKQQSHLTHRDVLNVGLRYSAIGGFGTGGGEMAVIPHTDKFVPNMRGDLVTIRTNSVEDKMVVQQLDKLAATMRQNLALTDLKSKNIGLHTRIQGVINLLSKPPTPASRVINANSWNDILAALINSLSKLQKDGHYAVIDDQEAIRLVGDRMHVAPFSERSEVNTELKAQLDVMSSQHAGEVQALRDRLYKAEKSLAECEMAKITLEESKISMDTDTKLRLNKKTRYIAALEEAFTSNLRLISMIKLALALLSAMMMISFIIVCQANTLTMYCPTESNRLPCHRPQMVAKSC